MQPQEPKWKWNMLMDHEQRELKEKGWSGAEWDAEIARKSFQKEQTAPPLDLAPFAFASMSLSKVGKLPDCHYEARGLFYNDMYFPNPNYKNGLAFVYGTAGQHGTIFFNPTYEVPSWIKKVLRRFKAEYAIVSNGLMYRAGMPDTRTYSVACALYTLAGEKHCFENLRMRPSY